VSIIHSQFNMFYLYSHDLDNIVLENLGEARTLQAVFELEAIVLTGEF
jgi:hypothetical protein